LLKNDDKAIPNTLMAMPRLILKNITKKYPSVVANSDVCLEVEAGQIHAILGENGAGKSTLMKVIFGAVRPDAGEIYWNGGRNPINIANPQKARELGISMVFQHFSLFETLNVQENILLGLSKNEVNRLQSQGVSLADKIKAIGQLYGLPVDPQQSVHSLSVGERQRIEIIRALLTSPKLLILDEPTSVLTPQAVDKLFVTLRQLASEGCSILYISHKLDEIKALCHKATVMRAGKVTGVCDPRLETAESLSRLMIGQAPQRHNAHRTAPVNSQIMLQVNQFSSPKQHAFGTELKNISMQVSAGEIVGLAGISGNGQQELMAALSGEVVSANAGSSLQLGGKNLGSLSIQQRRALGLGFIPEERLGRGAVPSMSLASNTLLSHQQAPLVRQGIVSIIDAAATRDLARSIMASFNVKAPSEQTLANSLSGGNLQKYIVGRELLREPTVLLISQPTWGVDVGAAAQIRGELLALRDRGCAILLVSEEVEELLEISDRLHVISQGKVSPSIETSLASSEQIGLWMSGLWPNDLGKSNAESAHVAH
jgi:general nucleoside transport system ATP-binding protein